MTVSRKDVQAFSSGPAPDAPPLPVDEADRVAAVLNRNSIHRPGDAGGAHASDVGGKQADRSDEPVSRTVRSDPGPRDPAPGSATRLARGEVLRLMQRVGFSSAQIDEVCEQLSDEMDAEQERAVLQRYGLTRALLMDRFGSSP